MTNNTLPYENLALVKQVVGQIFPGHPRLVVERVREGVSTAVYRVREGDRIYYLRVLPEVDASFAPERYVHAALRAWGLPVPEVLYFEAYQPLLHRSVMLTTAIAGQAIGYEARPAPVQPLVRAAGRDLARLNRLPVQGFGWVLRSNVAEDGLYAEYSTSQEWLARHFEEPLQALRQSPLLSPAAGAALQEALAAAAAVFRSEPAVLAHGDFDTTHIYHHEGQYTGIIDFGEIRGAPRLYDLGHFWIENEDILPALLDGYAEVEPLPADYQHQVQLLGLLIAARRLGRRLANQAASVYEPDVLAVRRALQA